MKLSGSVIALGLVLFAMVSAFEGHYDRAAYLMSMASVMLHIRDEP